MEFIFKQYEDQNTNNLVKNALLSCYVSQTQYVT